MKKLISIILALTMIFTCLNLSVYAQEGKYTQEELILLAKSMCNIGDYENFTVTNSTSNSNLTRYSFKWYDEEDENSVEINIFEDGIISKYVKKVKDIDKTTLYSTKEAQQAAEDFMKNVAGDNFDSLMYKSVYLVRDQYSFTYNLGFDNIPITGNSISLYVNKYTNEVVSYTFPHSLTTLSQNTFSGTKSLEEAKAVFCDNMDLVYYIDYSDPPKATLAYKPKDFMYKASDLTPLTKAMLNESNEESSSDSVGGAGGSGADNSLTEEEEKALLNFNNSISIDEAMNIYNTTLNDNLSKADVTYKYYKEGKDLNTYSIHVHYDDGKIYVDFSIDSKKRLTYMFYMIQSDRDRYSQPPVIHTQEEKEKIIEETLTRLNTSNYELTEPSYFTYPNDEALDSAFYLKRNGYTSEDEYIAINLDENGKVCYINTHYCDEAFESEPQAPQLTKEEAFEIAANKLGFIPCYAFKTTTNKNISTYSTIPAYAFEKQFAIDAISGELLNYYGGTLIESNKITEYTDLSDQWYADIAQKLVYLGLSFDGDTFDGDLPLTYESLRDLDYSLYPYDSENESVDMQANITRYEFSALLVDYMGYEEISQYNEMYVSPFSDVDYDHTGTVAILKAMGIISGDSFRGNDYITRAEAATMIYRHLIN